MACGSCGASSDTPLCQVCQCEMELAKRSGPRCRLCGLPIDVQLGLPPLCQVCGVLLLTVCRREWFIRAQAEWDEENLLLAKRKKELLGLRNPFPM
jgi:hypothetical protein